MGPAIVPFAKLCVDPHMRSRLLSTGFVFQRPSCLPEIDPLGEHTISLPLVLRLAHVGSLGCSLPATTSSLRFPSVEAFSPALPKCGILLSGGSGVVLNDPHGRAAWAKLGRSAPVSLSLLFLLPHPPPFRTFHPPSVLLRSKNGRYRFIFQL